MRDLKGKTAVITGAASGIGLGMAQRFAEEGMNVVLSDIEQGALDRAALDVASKATSGAKAIGVRADVTSAESVKALRDAAVAAFGRVHVLCANAGVASYGSVWEHTLDDWKWTLNVNLWGVIHTLHTFIPGMLAHGEEGHIVVTSSAGGLAAASSASYGASKFAVLGMAEGLELELRNTPIGVTALCPGGVKTGIYDSERNRPADLGERGTYSELVKGRLAALKNPDRVDQITPASMADQVVKAIRARELYIMPAQEAHRKVIRERLGKRLEAVRDSGA